VDIRQHLRDVAALEQPVAFHDDSFVVLGIHVDLPGFGVVGGAAAS
jgi:hypothetical protein